MFISLINAFLNTVQVVYMVLIMVSCSSDNEIYIYEIYI
jgi:hypothetical protein